MAKLTKTSNPGVYRRHRQGCSGTGRCDCAYVVVWRHRGKQAMKTFQTFAEAREAKGQREGGDSRPASKVRFGDYFEEWIESYAGRTSRGFSETSRNLYRRSINDHAVPRWRTWKVAEIEAPDVRALYAELRAGKVSTAGVRGLRAALSALFATAVEDGLARSNPVQGVRIPIDRDESPDDERAKALTRAELRRLFAVLPDEWRLFFEFLTHTGLRISEAVGLRWEHVDLGESPKVRVREQLYNGRRQRLKSGAGRRDIPLSPGMAKRLRARRRETHSDGEAPLFATTAGTELNRPNLAARVLKPAAKAADLIVERGGKRVPWVSFHTFRHTCASLLFDQGRNVKQVAEWLGHADPSFTLRTYVHLLDAGVGDAAFLDEATAPDSGQQKVNRASANSRKDA